MHAIEQAAFASWPALEEQDESHWRLRFSRGYTKRANSANALGQIDQLPSSQIERVENFYRARGATPIFRLASFCIGTAVDHALAEKGYRFTDLSLVMTAPLPEARPQSSEFLPGAAQ